MIEISVNVISEEESRSSHLLFTLHVYQYRVEKENRAGLPGGKLLYLSYISVLWLTI
jgi:hypothetical protein